VWIRSYAETNDPMAASEALLQAAH
jgi:hypothetical protein